MKKRIALFANGWNGENLDSFLKGFNGSFEEDVDVFVFSSYSAYSMDEVNRACENSIYDLPDYSTFDAAVVYGAGMNSDTKLAEVLQKCKDAKLPVVVQGVDVDGFSSVNVDHYAGMRQLCDHIIEEHGVKSVLFIGGSRDNADSNIRLQALRDSMDAHGLSFSDDDISYANWELVPVKEIIHKRYEDNLDALPDAILCANDPMALFAVLAIETLGARVPDDVIVTGFDNISEANTFYPSIASVDQCYAEQGSECGRIIQQQMAGNTDIEKNTIKCVASFGESCGCQNCKGEQVKRRILGHDVVYRRFETENLNGRLVRLETAFLTSVDFDEVAPKVYQAFNRPKGYETSEFHIYINPQYKNLLYLNSDTNGSYFENYYPEMDVLVAKTNGVLSKDKTFNSKDLFIDYTGDGEGKIYVFAPIRVMNHVAGYLVMGYSSHSFLDMRFFAFTNYLSRTMEKFQDNIKFVKLNEKLSELMQKDALTSVKNRTAYERYIAGIEKAIESGSQKQVAIVMCDINNLKTINDNLGHEAGDEYIKNCCRAMCEIYKHSPVFRIGGDEFIIVLAGEDYDSRDIHMANIRQRIEDASSNTDPTQKISFAIGMAEFDPSKDTKIADTAKRADAFMYLDKATMKARML